MYIYIHARARAFLCVCVCVLMHTLHAFWPRKQLHSPNYLAISQDRIQNRQIERSCVGPSQSCNKHKDRYEDASARVKDRYTEECVCVCARALACVLPALEFRRQTRGIWTDGDAHWQRRTSLRTAARSRLLLAPRLTYSRRAHAAAVSACRTTSPAASLTMLQSGLFLQISTERPLPVSLPI